ncbi:MAG: hypothetical protein NDJ92_14800 [Thermoanaerobaculia bacterium]|nr:hypothetical protein [Thermoanaerobaculia bacterium]
MALQLKKIGIDNVRPLEGGLDSWRQKGRTLQSGRIAVPLTTDRDR